MAAASSSGFLSSSARRKSSSSSSLLWKLPRSPTFAVSVSVSLPRRRPVPPVFVVVAMHAKPTVLVAEKLGEAGLEFLKDVTNVDFSYNLSLEELCTRISLCDALIVRSGTKVTCDVFDASVGRLKFVGRAGVGIDNVDLVAATEFGCLVVNAPTANTVAAAEHGIALLTNWIIAGGSLDTTVTFESFHSPIDSETVDADGKPPLVLKPSSRDCGLCEIKRVIL